MPFCLASFPCLIRLKNDREHHVSVGEQTGVFFIDDEVDGENKSRHTNAKYTPWFRPQFNDTETSSDDQDEV